jgi:hypothetical protein
MRLPVPAFFRRLDRHLLRSYPVLWLLRLHYVLAVWLTGLALIVAVALALPIRISTVLPFGRPYWLILGAIALLAAPWIYLQAQAAAPLRHDPRPKTGVVLLAAYLGFSALFLLWPVAFYRLFEARISHAVTAADDAILREFSVTNVPGPGAEKLLQRFGKGSAMGDPLTPERLGDAIVFRNEDSRFLSVLLAVKHSAPDREEWLEGQRTSGVLYNWRWASALILAILACRVVQVVEREDVIPLLVVVGLVEVMVISLNVSGHPAPPFLVPAQLALVGIGAVATFGGGANGPVTNKLLTLGTTIFFLNLPFSVLFAWCAHLLGRRPIYPQQINGSLALGLALLFAFAYFIQRRLFSLAAAPR